MNTNEIINYAAADKAIKTAEAMLVALQSMRAAGDVNEWHWVDADKIFRTAVRAANLAMVIAVIALSVARPRLGAVRGPASAQAGVA
jgi:hypothetical protein